MGADYDYPLGTVAFFAALIFPIFLVLRWQGIGFFIAVLFGWAIIHASNMIAPVDAPVDAVFKGIWAWLGWAYMLAWCSVVTAFVAASRWVTKWLFSDDSLRHPARPELFPEK